MSLRDVFDGAIREAPVSTVDVDRVVAGQRRAIRRRRTLGTGLTVLIVLAAGVWLITAGPGATRTVGPATTAVVTTPAPAPVRFLGGRPSTPVAVVKAQLQERAWQLAQAYAPGIAWGPAEAGRDTFAVEHIDGAVPTVAGGIVPEFSYTSRAIGVRDADHAGTLTLVVARMTTATGLPTCAAGRPRCRTLTHGATTLYEWQDFDLIGGSWIARPGLHAARIVAVDTYVEVSISNTEPSGQLLAAEPPLTQDEVDQIAAGLDFALY